MIMKRTLPSFGFARMIRLSVMLLTLGLVFNAGTSRAQTTPSFIYSGSERVGDTIFVNACSSIGSIGIDHFLVTRDVDGGETLSYRAIGATSGSFTGIPYIMGTLTSGADFTPPTATYNLASGASGTIIFRIRVDDGTVSGTTVRADTMWFKITVVPAANAGTISAIRNYVHENDTLKIASSGASGGTGTWSTSGTGNYSVSTAGIVNGINASGNVDTAYFTVTPSAGCPTSISKFPFRILSRTTPFNGGTGSVSGLTVTPGTSITITGSNFNTTASNNIVYIGGVRAIVTAATATTLTVTVPTGASFGAITVTDAVTRLSGRVTSASFSPTFTTSAFNPASIINMNRKDSIILSGGYASTSGSANGVAPFTIAVGDLDGDGKNDFAVAGNDNRAAFIGKIWIYRNVSSTTANLGSSSFALVDTIQGGASVGKLMFADMDNDGKLDVVSTSLQASTVAIHRNKSTTGSIDFDHTGWRITTVPAPNEIYPVDLNNDGRMDIAMVSLGFNAGSTHLNATLTTIMSRYNPPTVSMSDGALGVYALSLFDTATAFRYSINDLDYPTGLTAGDFDNDGKVDLAVALHASRKVDIFKNTTTAGSSTFAYSRTSIDVSEGASGYPNKIIAANIDGDTFTDLAVTLSDSSSDYRSTYNKVAVIRNTSSGFSSTLDRTSVGAIAPYGIAAGDIDADGKVDIVHTNIGNATVGIIRNTSSGGITLSSVRIDTVDNTTISGGRFAAPIALAVADFDGNTVPDLAIANHLANTVTLFRGNPLPDTGSIRGADSICSGTPTRYASFHRPGAIGTWSFSGSAIASITPGASDTEINVIGATAGGFATITYTVVALSDTNRVIKRIFVRPDATTPTINGVIRCVGTSATITANVDFGAWTSSDTLVASVVATGTRTGSVTARSAGSTIITYTSGDPACGTIRIDTALVTVNPLPDTGTVSGPSFVCGSSTATYSSSGFVGTPTWSSTALTGTSINATTGVLTTGTTAGTITVSFSVTNSCGTRVATRTVTVGGSLPPAPVITDAVRGVNVGSSINVTASPSAGGSWSTTSGGFISSVTATSASGGISTVTLNGVRIGTDTVIFTTTTGCGSASDTMILNVVTGNPPIIISVTPVSVNPNGTTVLVKGSSFNTTRPSGNVAMFGTTPGRVTYVSPTGDTLLVRVPLNVEYDWFSVTDSASKLTGFYTRQHISPYYDSSAMIPSTLDNFVAPVTFQTLLPGVASVAPYALEFSDVDMDGRPDMLVSGVFCDSILVYRNIQPQAGSFSASTFAPPVGVRVYNGRSPVNIKVADLDNDKFPELVAACLRSGDVVVVKNRSTPGTISFGAPIKINGTQAAPSEIAIADFDRDGRQDILVACRGFEPSSIVGGLDVLRNTSNPLSDTGLSASSFALSHLYVTGPGDLVLSLAVADFNTDDKMDVVITQHNKKQMLVFENTSTPGVISFGAPDSIRTSVGFPNQVRTGDLDNDGRAEIAVAVADSDLASFTPSPFNRILIYKNNITSGGSVLRTGFDTGLHVATGLRTTTLAIGDINGDHAADIVAANSQDGTISFIKHDVTTGLTFTTPTTVSIRPGASSTALARLAPVSIALADIDTNTVLDLAVVSRDSDLVFLYRGFPIPDTTPITGPDIICSTATATLRSSHRVGSRGYWSSTNGRVGVSFSATSDTFATIYGASAGTDTILYHVVALYDTNTVRYVVHVLPRPDSVINSLSTDVCISDTTTLVARTGGGTWTSSDTSIATIDGVTGLVTGIRNGTAIITYSISTPRCSVAIDTVSVTVKFSGVITGVSTVCTGGSVTLNNASASAGTFVWGVKRGRVSLGTTTSSTANVNGVSLGTDSVYYTIGGACDTAWFAMTVVGSGFVPSITTSTTSICSHSSFTFGSTSTGGTWSTSNASVASIDPSTGVATGLTSGVSRIKYTITATCGTFVDSVDLTVTPLDAGTITGLASICVGDTTTYADTALTGTWFSGDPSVFTINPTTGFVRGIAAGTDTIFYVVASASCGAPDTATFVLTVNGTVVGPVNGLTSVCIGTTTTYTDTVAGGTWSVSSTSVATIDPGTGLFTPLTAGSVLVSYTVTGCATIFDTLRVSVVNTPSAGTISADTLCVGTTHSLVTTGTGGTWSVSDPSIASVSSSGSITGRAYGSVTVTYLVVSSCGRDSATQTIVVDTAAAVGPITFSDSDTICAGGTLVASNSTTGGAWASTRDTIAVIDASGNITPASRSGIDTTTITYTVRGRFGCADRTVGRRLYVAPAVSAGTLSPVTRAICRDSSITLIPSVAGGTFVSRSTNATVSSTGVVTGVTGVYNSSSTGGSPARIVYFVNSPFGCGTDSVSRIVNVQDTAIVALSNIADSVLCIGSSRSYTASILGGTWSALGGNVSVTSTGTVTGVSTGRTGVLYTIPVGVCPVSRTTLTVVVDSALIGDSILMGDDLGNVGPGHSICLRGRDTTARFIAAGGSGYSSWSWTSSVPLEFDTVRTTRGDAVYSTNGVSRTYNVIRIVSARCGSDTTTFAAVVRIAPDAGRGDSFRSVCPNDTIQIAANTKWLPPGSSLTTRTWTSSDSTVATATTGATTTIVTGLMARDTAYIIATAQGRCYWNDSLVIDSAVFGVRVLDSVPNPGVITGGAFACLGAAPVTLFDTTAGGTGVWSSTNTSVATINNSGVVTPLTIGSTTIWYVVSNICGLDSTSVVFKVSNAPKLIKPTATSVCDSTLLSITLNADSTGSSFNWSRPTVNGIANDTASGATALIAEYLDDTTGRSIIVKYLVTTSKSGCSSNDSFNVTVKPTPYLTSASADTICSGAEFVYTFTATTGAGTTGAWTRPNITNITPAGPVNGTGGVREILTNGILLPVNVPYTYTLLANGCSGSGSVIVTVNPRPDYPKIVTHSPPNLCKKTEFMNYGANVPPPPSVTYFWTADNAEVWATGRSRQYSLVNFNTFGTATVFLNAIIPGYNCPARDSFVVNVSNQDADSPEVIYWNHDFICQSSSQDTYQWGYDDAINLDSAMFPGQTNQNMTVDVPDFTNKFYWVITTKGGCMQKSYYRHRKPTETVDLTNIAEMNIYPNPADQFVNVELKNAQLSGKFNYAVVDMSGRRITEDEILNNHAIFDISDYASGMYFVECYHNGVKFATTKFVKN